MIRYFWNILLQRLEPPVSPILLRIWVVPLYTSHMSFYCFCVQFSFIKVPLPSIHCSSRRTTATTKEKLAMVRAACLSFVTKLGGSPSSMANGGGMCGVPLLFPRSRSVPQPQVWGQPASSIRQILAVSLLLSYQKRLRKLLELEGIGSMGEIWVRQQSTSYSCFLEGGNHPPIR